MTTQDAVPFRAHTLESAPDASRHALQALEKDFGFIPNVAAVMAESPVTMNAFVGVFETFHRGTFTEAERQVLLLTNAVTNRCSWAVALHSAVAASVGVSEADVRAIREQRLPGDPRLAALSRYSRVLIDKRGHAEAQDIRAFRQAGFSHPQVLEVIVAVVGSTFTNYTANVAHPVVEAQFERFAWAPRGESLAEGP